MTKPLPFPDPDAVIAHLRDQAPPADVLDALDALEPEALWDVQRRNMAILTEMGADLAERCLADLEAEIEALLSAVAAAGPGGQEAGERFVAAFETLPERLEEAQRALRDETLARISALAASAAREA